MSVELLTGFTSIFRSNFLSDIGIQQVTMTPLYSSNAEPVVERRSHKNKYSKFATKELDPLEEAIKKNKEKLSKERIKAETDAPIRGTTVPMRTKENPKIVAIINATNTPVEAATSTDGKDDFGKSVVSSKINIFFQNQSAIIPSDPFTFGYAQIGTIGVPHGVKGELKVYMDTDFALDRLQQGQLLHVKRPNRLTPRPIRIETGRKQVGNNYLVKFELVNTRLGAAAFKNFGVFVRLDNRPVLQAEEYLVRDLVDLDCYIEEISVDDDNVSVKTAKLVGCVIGVVPPDELCDPAMAKLMHAMLEIRLADTEDKLCLIPLVPSIVTSVDMLNRKIILDPPKGLLDNTYLEKKIKVVIRGFLPERAAHLSKEDRKYLVSVSKLQLPRHR
jgi:16S rRNA processing protein RimM